ncbi:MAG: ATP-dependent zinc metalloprotease FtsH [Bacteroidales bacterium]|nr:ATP-dependent zinc metalloprotease FtsH [Bacteroidales bacterium]
MRQPRRGFNWFSLVYLILLLGLAYMWSSTGTADPLKREWIDVKETLLTSGDVEKLVYVRNEHKGEIFLKQSALEKYKNLYGGREPKGGPHFYFLVSEKFDAENQLDALVESLPEENRFKVVVEEHKSYWGPIIEWLLFPLMLLLMFFFFMRPMRNMGGGSGGGIFSVGKSQAKLYEKAGSVKVTFKDVAGMEEAKLEVKEIVDFIKNPKKYTNLGGKIPTGALLVGPPGTGKTLLAKAVAGEADVPFFSMSGSDFVEMFVGVGASRVRDLFRQAKEKAPCIVFIDEIDAVGRARGKNVGFSSNDERENTLNQLLTEMDGFGTNSGVIVLAATNRADILDKALMRAGRFDRQIHVELPELKERVEIFQVHMKGLKIAEDFDLDFMAKHTPGFSGADIANVCNEAALTAARKDKKAIDRQDFLDAVDRVVGGLERKGTIMTPAERRSIAHHEAGHAVTSWLLPYAHPLFKVTLIPRGQALGAAWYLPEERKLWKKSQLMDEMCSLIGGRVAEEIVDGEPSTGAQNDLERLTQMAYNMVQNFGMSDKVGYLSFYDSTGARGYDLTKPYSEKTAELMDEEVKKLVRDIHDRTLKILTDHKEGFLQVAALLLEKEVIFADDVEAILGPKVTPPAEEKKEEA